jgi:hypothetical protein
MDAAIGNRPTLIQWRHKTTRQQKQPRKPDMIHRNPFFALTAATAVFFVL